MIIITTLATGALLGFGVLMYNSLVRSGVEADEAFAQIEVQLKRRSDLIPNLVETVKGYASHESVTFEEVTKARAAAQSATGVEQVAEADGMLTRALRGLLMVSEAYPDLKASANFLSLQEELSTSENKIAFARQRYNDVIRSLNTKVKTFPGNLFAGIAKVQARAMYEVENEADRRRPDVSF